MDEELGFPFDADYLDKQDLFLDAPADAPQEIVVWVESRDDVRLWKRVLRDSKSFKYDFRPASMFRSADGKRANGCSRLIKLYKSGEIQSSYKSIFCLDSDFKYLAKLSGCYSGEDYNYPGFYWTIVHSKEHFFVSSEVVDEITSHITCIPVAQLPQRASDIYLRLSETIYASFVRLMYLRAGCFESPLQVVLDYSERLDSCLVSLLDKPQGLFDTCDCPVWNNFEERLRVLTEDVCGYLISEGHEQGFIGFEESLHQVGVNSTNIYLFYRGHDWFALCYGIAKSYIDSENKLRLDEIIAVSVDKKRDVREYKNQTPKLREAFLMAMPTVDDFPFFKSTVELLRATYPERY